MIVPWSDPATFRQQLTNSSHVGFKEYQKEAARAAVAEQEEQTHNLQKVEYLNTCADLPCSHAIPVHPAVQLHWPVMWLHGAPLQ